MRGHEHRRLETRLEWDTKGRRRSVHLVEEFGNIEYERHSWEVCDTTGAASNVGVALKLKAEIGFQQNFSARSHSH